MGKKSKYPSYSSGSITVNGQTVATNKRDSQNNIVDSSYNMSEKEKEIYDSVQDNLMSSLGNLFSISDEKREEWGNQLDAYKNQGIKEINDIFTPMETDLKNDISSRFGNLNNSIFLDQLDNITDKKAQATAQLSENITALQSDLYNQELTNRLNLISFLNGLYSGFNNNILNYIQAANANAGAGNSYNNAAYNASNQNSWLGTLTNFGTNVLGNFTNAYSNSIFKK